MTVTYGFYNSQSGDRVYDALQMSSILQGVITDGILKDIGGELEVTAGSGMNASVAAGKAWFKNTWTYNDVALTVAMDAAHPTLPRIDRVILEVDMDLAVRANSIKKLTGTPASSPEAPTLIQTATKQQYPLARIAIAAGATSLGTITDERDSVDCGYAELMLAGSALIQEQIDDLVAEDIVINDYIKPLFYNKSGGTLNEGALVIFDKANAQSFKTTTGIGDRRIMGVVKDTSIANDAQGNIAMFGINKVLVQGNVNIGDALISSSTAGRAMANGTGWQPGLLGFAITAYAGGGAGDVLAILNPDFARAGGSISFISSQYGSATGGGNCTVSTNLGASANEKLVLIFSMASAVLTGVTFDGVAATTVLAGGVSLPGCYRYQTSATGSKNVVSTIGSGNTQLVVIVLEGHSPSTPVRTANRTTAASTTPSVSCTDAVVGDYIVDFLILVSGTVGDISSLGAGQSEIFAPVVIGGTNVYELSKKDALSATDVMTAILGTSRTWHSLSVPVQPI